MIVTERHITRRGVHSTGSAQNERAPRRNTIYQCGMHVAEALWSCAVRDRTRLWPPAKVSESTALRNLSEVSFVENSSLRASGLSSRMFAQPTAQQGMLGIAQRLRFLGLFALRHHYTCLSEQRANNFRAASPRSTYKRRQLRHNVTSKNCPHWDG